MLDFPILLYPTLYTIICPPPVYLGGKLLRPESGSLDSGKGTAKYSVDPIDSSHHSHQDIFVSRLYCVFTTAKRSLEEEARYYYRIVPPRLNSLQFNINNKIIMHACMVPLGVFTTQATSKTRTKPLKFNE